MTNRQANAGFTLIELLVVVSVIGILAAIAVPSLVRARQSGFEASAIGSIRAINSAQVIFAASCGAGGYAVSLAALAVAAPMGAPFISSDLASGIKSGYTVAETGGGIQILPAASTCNTAGNSMATFLVTATPLVVGSTGQRSFGSDQAGAIYQDMTGLVLTAPLTLGGAIQFLQ